MLISNIERWFRSGKEFYSRVGFLGPLEYRITLDAVHGVFIEQRLSAATAAITGNAKSATEDSVDIRERIPGSSLDKREELRRRIIGIARNVAWSLGANESEERVLGILKANNEWTDDGPSWARA